MQDTPAKKYCAAPWRGLHINPRGDVKTCCAGDPNMLGNLNQQSIAEILLGDKMQEIRDHMIKGELHPQYCHNCILAERYGTSERQWHNSVNPDIDFAEPGSHVPAIIDARWNITCNMSCNYCGPKCSSQCARHMRINHRSGARPYIQQVCDYIKEHHTSVREVALVGGEPLLLPENEQLLAAIPESSIVTLITNLNVDFSHNPVVALLRDRCRVGWSISFDNIGERFEYVRSGGRWRLMDHNLRQVKKLMQEQQHWGGIHAVYNLYNCTQLCELRDYADSLELTINWQTLYQPDYLDPAMHAPWVRDLATREIQKYQAQYQLRSAEQDFFGSVLDRLRTIDPDWEMVSVRLREHIHLIETKYHKQDAGQWARLWPEFAEI